MITLNYSQLLASEHTLTHSLTQISVEMSDTNTYMDAHQFTQQEECTHSLRSACIVDTLTNSSGGGGGGGNHDRNSRSKKRFNKL